MDMSGELDYLKDWAKQLMNTLKPRTKPDMATVDMILVLDKIVNS